MTMNNASLKNYVPYPRSMVVGRILRSEGGNVSISRPRYVYVVAEKKKEWKYLYFCFNYNIVVIN